MSYIKKGLLGLGVALTSLSMLTACEVVKGTVSGTEQVVKGTVNGTEKVVSSGAHAVDKALTPTKATAKKKVVHHKKAHHHHKKAVKKAAPVAPKVNDVNDVTLGS